MKKALLIIWTLALSATVPAQTDNKNAVVNVENDYTPEVIEVTKKNFTPSDETKSDVTPMSLMFSKTGKTFNGFTSETDAESTFPKKEEQFPGYVRLGYGLTNDIDAKAAYRIGIGSNGNLKAYAAFDGYKSNVDGFSHKWNSRMFNTLAGFGYTHRFKTLTLGVDGDFKNTAFNYQNIYNVITDRTDKQDGQNYRLVISGTSNLPGAFSYKFNGGVEYITRNWSSGKKSPIGEMHYKIGGGVKYEIMSEILNNLGIDLNVDAFTYNSTLKSAAMGYNSYFSIDADPYLDFTFGKWTVDVGTKMNFLTRGRGVFAIAPDINIKGNIRDNIALFGSITGGRTNNGFAVMDNETPYWGFVENATPRLKPTYRIVDVDLGSRISFEPLSIGVSAGYAYTKDDLLEALPTQSFNQFTLMYAEFGQENTHHAYADLELGFDWRSWVKLSAGARYDFWHCNNNALLVMKPQITVDANAEARVIEHLTMRVGYNFTRYTKSSTVGRIGNKNDLYARISYQINKRFGAYIQGNNLLNCKYYDYAGYVTRGIRGSLGATVNF